MNEWLDALQLRIQTLLEPWMPWASDVVQLLDASLAQMPSLVWAGAALWLAMMLADRLQPKRVLRSTVYVVCGAVLALLLSWLTSPDELFMLAHRSEWLLDIALGWILFTVGQQMDMRWLLRNKALAATAVLEFGITVVSVSALLMMLGLAWPAACVAGVIAAHSSPVVLASFMPDWQADGQISARALHLGGINTLLAALSLPLVLVLGQAWLQGAAQITNLTPSAASAFSLPSLQRSGWDLAQPMLLLLLSLCVGAVLGRMLARAQPVAGSSVQAGWQAAEGSMGLVAAACVCAGLAQWWGAPAWAACLALGLTLRSPTGAAWRSGQGVQQALTMLAQLVLFALSALTLLALLTRSSTTFSQLNVAVGMLLPLVALVLLLRLSCKLLVCTLMARWAGLRWPQGFALGLAMQPLSMTGLALLLMAWPLLMLGDALLASSLVLVLMVSDVLAPLGMKTLLKRCGEIAPEEIAGMTSRSSTQALRFDNTPGNPADTARDRDALAAQAPLMNTTGFVSHA
jgi:Kef-type K+ transport system membrane component KefB